jgi:hypothetical protein
MFVWAFEEIGSILFTGTEYGGVFRSTDGAGSWDTVNTGLSNLNVRALELSGATLFAGTSGGGVFLSADSGATWAAANSGLTNTDVRALVVLGTDLFAGTFGGGVFRSTDNGGSWAEASPGLTSGYVFSLVSRGTNLFAGTSYGGVFLSTDSGDSWAPVNTGLGNTEVQAIEVLGTDLVAGTQGSGVWRRPLDEMVTSVGFPSGRLPTVMELHQNYPNPFNPATHISFSLPDRTHVRLTVYNALGEEVATLVDGEIVAGHHTVVFDASSVASGLYLYRLAAGGFVRTKKMILLR